MISDESLAVVARRLKQAGLEDSVFVGGAVVGLLLTDPLAPPTRFTDDVDVVVSTPTRGSYNRIEERMRMAGHTQAQGGPICRWMIDDVKVDLMPTDDRILGFSNRWYSALVKSPHELVLQGDVPVKVVSAPYLVATKLEAFHDRGEGNYLGSKDIEDIVILVDGREELVGEIDGAEPKVRHFIVEEIRALLDSEGFRTSLPAHMLPDEASQARVALVLARMNDMARIGI